MELIEDWNIAVALIKQITTSIKDFKQIQSYFKSKELTYSLPPKIFINLNFNNRCILIINNRCIPKFSPIKTLTRASRLCKISSISTPRVQTS